ncbi:MAG TPA: hypothetical protein VLF87_01525 [Patescibacteria group bacterium]|nr:hypothetical protein [Patescibacteria group bacterium]
MADSLASLLDGTRYQEPPEVQVIKDFLREHYQADCQVTVQQRQIVITVKGASLAGALRMRLHQLQALCQTDKRLVIRIR